MIRSMRRAARLSPIGFALAACISCSSNPAQAPATTASSNDPGLAKPNAPAGDAYVATTDEVFRIDPTGHISLVADVAAVDIHVALDDVGYIATEDGVSRIVGSALQPVAPRPESP